MFWLDEDALLQILVKFLKLKKNLCIATAGAVDNVSLFNYFLQWM